LKKKKLKKKLKKEEFKKVKLLADTPIASNLNQFPNLQETIVRNYINQQINEVIEKKKTIEYLFPTVFVKDTCSCLLLKNTEKKFYAQIKNLVIIILNIFKLGDFYVVKTVYEPDLKIHINDVKETDINHLKLFTKVIDLSDKYELKSKLRINILYTFMSLFETNENYTFRLTKKQFEDKK